MMAQRVSFQEWSTVGVKECRQFEISVLFLLGWGCGSVCVVVPPHDAQEHKHDISSSHDKLIKHTRNETDWHLLIGRKKHDAHR
mmetsp:Transcript_18274/g.27126  ORF Transcript_18274/g.27126 Transcript_18274/m.27126 type:complete len:84 (+) Transcript_18274:317-568(+)